MSEEVKHQFSVSFTLPEGEVITFVKEPNCFIEAVFKRCDGTTDEVEIPDDVAKLMAATLKRLAKSK